LDVSGFADDRPANPDAGFAKDAARVAPSPWGEGRVEGERKTNFEVCVWRPPSNVARAFGHDAAGGGRNINANPAI